MQQHPPSFRIQRLNQLVFSAAVVVSSWLAMQALHELGHVVGALASGGSIVRVVLHPWAISHTEVAPNPHPGFVVWLGPIVGCLLPVICLAVIPQRRTVMQTLARFFAGFCLVANGAYVSLGSFRRIGDCEVMLRTGTPQWVMLAFGAMTLSAGLILWHGLGSVDKFVNQPAMVSPRMTVAAAAFLILMLSSELALSPR